MRKRMIPECPPEPPKVPPTRDEYAIKLITPLFGGGAVAGVNDVEMPIRATSIRGQLQFWWRATRGATLALRDMRRRHAEIFGDTEMSSALTVTVSGVKSTRRIDASRYGALGYALFPARDKDSLLYEEGLEFNLGLHCHTVDRLNERRKKQNDRRVRDKKKPLPELVEDIRPDVEVAMWAWVNFGGLGARTRRGCGALWCDRLAPTSVDALREDFAKYVTASPGREWPTMPDGVLVKPPPGNPLVKWGEAVGVLRDFRQGERIARDGRQGRSFYPEPDTIRRVTQCWLPAHAPRDTPDGFPRAEFGLPIVFKFKDDRPRKPGESHDPKQTVLYPFVGGEKKGRMASPLILKPLALRGGRTAVPLILALKTPGVSQVELQANEGQCLTPRRAVPVRAAAFSTYPDSPLSTSPTGSALEAFLAFARTEDFA